MKKLDLTIRMLKRIGLFLSVFALAIFVISINVWGEVRLKDRGQNVDSVAVLNETNVEYDSESRSGNLKDTGEDKEEDIEDQLELELYKNYLYENITNIIAKYVNSEDIAVSFTDLRTGVYIGINDNIEFTAASTTKLPLALLICSYLESGQISLNDTIKYTASDYEGGAGVMFDAYEGEEYTIETLLSNMIIYSDNISKNMFYRYFGYSEARRAMGQMIGIEINPNENKISSFQMNEFLKLLHESKDKNYYNELIELLKNTIFHDRLDKYLPYEIVAHKIGNYEGNTHDVGIVMLDKPYAITVLTHSIYNAEEIISSISKEIYDFYTSLEY